MKTNPSFKRSSSNSEKPLARKRIIWMFAVLFFSGCNAAPSSVLKPTYTVVPSLSPTIILTKIPTLTKTEPTNIQTPLTGSMTEECLELNTAPVNEVTNIKGLVASERKSGTAFFWNRNLDHTYFPVRPNGRVPGAAVSPNHKYVLYLDTINQGRDWMVKIIDNSTKIVYSKSIRPSDLFDWFDNQRLWHFYAGDTNSPPEYNLLNPFTGLEQELKLDLPFILQGAQSADAFRWTANYPLYDPQLTRAVYPACDDNCPYVPGQAGTGHPIVLYDMETNKILSKLVTLADRYGTTPIWLSDGSSFIMTADIYSTDDPKRFEFFSVSRDGKITQLTHLHDSYTSVEISMFYTISPNDHYLAFWIRVPPHQEEDARLAVLNLDSGAVINYCISGFSPIGFDSVKNIYIDNYSYPIWSPDRTQLAIQTRDPQMPENSLITLVDLKQNKAVQVNSTDNLDPVGWLSLP